MTSQGETGGTQLKPPVEAVRSHYDKSNEFFKLWLDPSMTYSCAYFEERPNMTLEEAQFAKRKLALDKLNLEPGMTLLDIGCGWGSTMRHAVQEYDVNVIGLTLSENQFAHDKAKFEEVDSPRRKEVRIQGWEQFDEPVDRIVSLGAFEHFADGAGDAGYERYATFFKKYYNLLPDDGRMLLHTIVVPSAEQTKDSGLKIKMSLLRFISFILREIFPGGKLPQIDQVDHYSTQAGFKIERHHEIGWNYVRTLNAWADALEAHKEEAIALKGQETYDIYMH
ncbi:cyclopropane mycolic acid synthase family methyltransferase, partial [Mycobacterium montefiorense]